MNGFSQEAKKRLFSFLVNRRKKVNVNGMFFLECEILNPGVPQGTIFGPLIFLFKCERFFIYYKHYGDYFYLQITQVFLTIFNHMVIIANCSVKEKQDVVKGTMHSNLKRTSTI